MTDEILIKVEHVSKKFCRDLKTSLWYGVQDIASEVTGRKYEHELRQNEFWSVNDINFELKRGECLGLIGPNGAGKSTLLKMLNGLFKPDRGRIELRGRVNSLIELSAGFNAILTGRENIYSRGAVLGFTTAEIDKKLDAIIDFSELEEFIDSPVVNYSSGMKVRLGFAVAAQMEPDVLLLDEVLAVGDVGFRAKCFNAIYKMINNAAVILVSHSMPQISRVCSDIMVMNHGKSEFQGKNIAQGVDKFYSYFKGEEKIVAGSGKAVIDKVYLSNKNNQDIEEISYLDELMINFEVTIRPEIQFPCMTVTIMSQELQNVIQSISLVSDVKIINTGEKIKTQINIGKIQLNPGNYSLNISVQSENFGEELIRYHNCKKFKVVGNFCGTAPIQIPGQWSFQKMP
ncbi:MAG TPA: ABC transporter [Cyanothece sp. UBA12306]|nr:ABC transporter [Cyanothece sp. UBA12306]